MAEQEARQNVRHKGNDKSDIVGNNLNQEKKKEALRKQQESTGNTISEHRREQLHEENEELQKDHGASSPVTLPLPGICVAHIIILFLQQLTGNLSHK